MEIQGQSPIRSTARFSAGRSTAGSRQSGTSPARSGGGQVGGKGGALRLRLYRKLPAGVDVVPGRGAV